MGILVLVLLVAAWGLVLGPALLRTAREPSPIETERMFNRALRALGGPGRPRAVPGGRWVLVLPSPEYPPRPGSTGRARPATAAERRRRNLSYLAAFTIVTFVLGLFRPLRFLLVLNLVADVLLIGYLGAVLYVVARPAAVGTSRPSGEEHPAPSEAVGGGW